MLPLTELGIRAYRGLRDVRLPDLGRVNLFVGGTNSGKTSVLEAVSLVADPLEPLTWTHTANRREPSPFAALVSSVVDRVRYLFPAQNEHPGPIKIELEGRHAVRAFEARLSLLRGMRPGRVFVDAEDEDQPQPVTTEVDRSGVEISVTAALQEPSQKSLFDGQSAERSFAIWEGEGFGGQPKHQYYPSLRVRAVTPYDHWLRSPTTRGLSDAVLTGDELSVVSLISSVAPRIVDIRLVEKQREPMVYLRDRYAGFLPLSSFGDGIRRVLSLALAVPRAKRGILLVDEIETGLHVSMLSTVYGWLWRACFQHDVQLFATTHSLEALDAMLDADTTDDEDTVAFQFLGDSDHPSVRRFGEHQLKRLRRERGLDIR